MTWFILIAFFTIFAVVLGKRIYDINSGKDKEFTRKMCENDDKISNPAYKNIVGGNIWND